MTQPSGSVTVGADYKKRMEAEMVLRFSQGSRGQGVVEYGLIIGLIAIIVIAVFVALGPQIKEIWSPDSVPTPPPSPAPADTQPS